MKKTEVFANKAIENIEGQPKDVLCEIYWVLNGFGWHEKLGEPPQGYENLNHYNYRLIDKLLRKETRRDYIHPIMKYIAQLVPMRTRYRFLHSEMTAQVFEDWYDSVRDELKKCEPY